MELVKPLISFLLVIMALASCGEVREDPPRVRDARVMITLLGPLGTPLSDRLHKDYAGIVATIDPVESGAENGGVQLRWIWKGQVIQAESKRAVDYDPPGRLHYSPGDTVANFMSWHSPSML